MQDDCWMLCEDSTRGEYTDSVTPLEVFESESAAIAELAKRQRAGRAEWLRLRKLPFRRALRASVVHTPSGGAPSHVGLPAPHVIRSR